MRRIVLLLLLLLLVVNFTMVWPADGKIIATGSGPTEYEARMDALRNAVEQGVGVLVNSQTFSKNLRLIEDKIFSKARGYVKSPTSISEKKLEDGNWEVTIECEVAEEKIKVSLKALGILRDMMGNPRIMIDYDPAITDGVPQEYHSVVSEAYEGIVEHLTEREFPVVAKRVFDQSGPASSKDSGKKTAQLELRKKAEYILVYNIKTVGQKSTNTFNRVWVMISAKIINISTGQILVIQNKKVMGVDKDSVDFAYRKGGRKAGKLAAKFLEDKLLTRWPGETVSGRVVILEVINIDDFSLLVNFKAELKKAYGVRNLFTRNSNSSTTEYEITYVGDIDRLKENAYTILEKMGLRPKALISHGDWICIGLIK